MSISHFSTTTFACCITLHTRVFVWGKVPRGQKNNRNTNKYINNNTFVFLLSFLEKIFSTIQYYLFNTIQNTIFNIHTIWTISNKSDRTAVNCWGHTFKTDKRCFDKEVRRHYPEVILMFPEKNLHPIKKKRRKKSLNTVRTKTRDMKKCICWLDDDMLTTLRKRNTLWFFSFGDGFWNISCYQQGFLKSCFTTPRYL